MSRLYEVVRLEGTHSVHVQDLAGAVSRASLLALDGVALAPGDWVVVHSGYVIELVDPVAARQIADEVQRAGALGAGEESEVGS
jgi:hydrogenase maturation factor